MLLTIALILAQLSGGTETVLKEAALAGKHSSRHTSAAMQPGTEDTLLINPSDRAKDWAQAYQFLTTRQSSTPIGFTLTNGTKLENILSLSVMSGGTLIAFQLNTPTGMKYQIVKVEDIAGIFEQ